MHDISFIDLYCQGFLSFVNKEDLAVSGCICGFFYNLPQESRTDFVIDSMNIKLDISVSSVSDHILYLQLPEFYALATPIYGWREKLITVLDRVPQQHPPQTNLSLSISFSLYLVSFLSVYTFSSPVLSLFFLFSLSLSLSLVSFLSVYSFSSPVMSLYSFLFSLSLSRILTFPRVTNTI